MTKEDGSFDWDRLINVGPAPGPRPLDEEERPPDLPKMKWQVWLVSLKDGKFKQAQWLKKAKSFFK